MSIQRCLRSLSIQQTKTTEAILDLKKVIESIHEKLNLHQVGNAIEVQQREVTLAEKLKLNFPLHSDEDFERFDNSLLDPALFELLVIFELSFEYILTRIYVYRNLFLTTPAWKVHHHAASRLEAPKGLVRTLLVAYKNGAHALKRLPYRRGKKSRSIHVPKVAMLNSCDGVTLALRLVFGLLLRPTRSAGITRFVHLYRNILCTLY